MKIGASIRKIREFRGFTQEFVADKLSLTQQAYSRWENDESDIPSSKLEKIAQMLNIRISDIFWSR